jgi:hypothetical protein
LLVSRSSLNTGRPESVPTFTLRCTRVSRSGQFRCDRQPIVHARRHAEPFLDLLR